MFAAHMFHSEKVHKNVYAYKLGPEVRRGAENNRKLHAQYTTKHYIRNGMHNAHRKHTYTDMWGHCRSSIKTQQQLHQQQPPPKNIAEKYLIVF